MIRKYKFAGSFYPSNKQELITQVNNFIENADVPNTVKSGISYISPHAGYIYSGQTAGYTYKALLKNNIFKSIDTIILIGPNHTGNGSAISVSLQDWETPLGILKNNIILSNHILRFLNAKEEEKGHEQEHSLEVQLPFLNKIAPIKKYCFIAMLDQSMNSSIKLSHAIISATAAADCNAIIIASSDFNHYESSDIAHAKDSELISYLLKMDYINFNNSIFKLSDTICGFGPITTALLFAKNKGVEKAKLLNYSDSGHETKDFTNVVAYASIVFG